MNSVEKVKESDTMVNHIKAYFAPLTMTADGITGIQLQNAGKQELIVKNRSGVWGKVNQKIM